jgi:NhaA family Na+:H+ antiporter
VLAGLLGGKVVGILGASVLAVKLGAAEKPRGMSWRDMAALSVLGGVGFTVSLLIADLSLPEGTSELAKAAVLIASGIASLLAAALLLRRSRVHARTD